MLKGCKIYLKVLEKKDILKLYQFSNDKNVKIYNTIPYDIQSSSENLRKAFSIFNEDNNLIGYITYKESNYCKNVYFIGITIGSMYWGRRYGQDSIKTLLRYLFIELNAVRIELEVIKTNLRAIMCYKKCGFIEKKVKFNKVYIDGKYVDTVIMSISRKN